MRNRNVSLSLVVLAVLEISFWIAVTAEGSILANAESNIQDRMANQMGIDPALDTDASAVLPKEELQAPEEPAAAQREIPPKTPEAKTTKCTCESCHSSADASQRLESPKQKSKDGGKHPSPEQNSLWTAVATLLAVLLAANLFRDQVLEFLKLKPAPEEKKKAVKRGSSKVTYTLLTMALVLFLCAFKGNPTQQLDKLFKMMRDGMAGGEDSFAFDKIYSKVGSNDQHNAYDADVANSFYNLATEFYEYGWGDSFHFGFRRSSEPHSKAIYNSQNFVAMKLNVKDMDQVLDVGCGIGGPLRGVVRATGANVTGMTINAHQIARAQEITRSLSPWMQQRCHFVRQDYLNIKTEENPGIPEATVEMELETYDAAFYMESSLHCENRTQTFSEVYKLLKPGGRLVAMEYNLLPGWNPEDPEHQELMRLHLHGNGAAKTPTVEEDLQMVRDAGFEVEEHYDFMAMGKKLYGDDSFEWWADLQFNWRFHLLPAHPWIRNNLPPILNALAYVGLVPEGVPKAADLMNMGGDGLSGLGKVNAITPQYFVLGVKPMK